MTSLWPGELDEREEAVAATAGAWLRENGVRMAALDVAGGKILDLNVTSPGMLVEMEAVLGRNLAGRVLRRLVASA